MHSQPLAGRVAVVTGVSRRRGIGFAIASRLATMGADLFLQHYAPHDAEQLIDQATARYGHLDILVCNHARSGGDGRLADLTPEMLGAHWQVNTRSTLLVTRAFAAQHDGREGGRHAGVTASVADDLVDRGIALNTVNPGPVNTAIWTRTPPTGH